MGRRLKVGWRSQLTAAIVGGMLAARASGSDDSPPPQAEPLQSIAEILATAPDALALQRGAVVRGVVTLVGQFRSGHDFVSIQDGDTAMYVDLRDYSSALPPGPSGMPALDFQLGDRIEVTGRTQSGSFAPNVMASSIRLLSRGTLPAAEPADMETLYEGMDAAKRVALRGTVQAVEERPGQEAWVVFVRTGGHRLAVQLPQAVFPERPAALLDAEIRVTGVVGSLRNSRGELIAPILAVARAEDLVVAAPAAGSGQPKMRLESIARFRPSRRGGHRITTEGVVSRAFPRTIYLCNAEGGVRVDLAGGATTDAVACGPGDRVEVVGFVTMVRGIAGLTGAIVRVIGTSPPPAAQPIDPAEIITADARTFEPGARPRPGNCDGSLVSLRARLETVTASPVGVELVMSAGSHIFSASLPADARARAAAQRIRPGSELQLTGIAELDLGIGRDPESIVEHPVATAFRLRLGGADDIAVLRLPPWWTPARLATAATILAAVLSGAGVWVMMLRREVSRQTALALDEATARRQGALEYEVTLRERNKLAADLHDTILQTVTAIGFQLHACEEMGAGLAHDQGQASRLASHLAAAKRIVEQAISQLRSAVWALRTHPADGMRFSAAVRADLEQLSEGQTATLTTTIDEVADHLPAFVAGSLLQIIKEAVRNSLRHAECRSIDVHVSVDTAADVAVASVADDGVGFVFGEQPGVTQGHFGLTGMHERAAEIGGDFRIRSFPGAGTTVVVTVPLGRPPKQGRPVAAAVPGPGCPSR